MRTTTIRPWVIGVLTAGLGTLAHAQLPPVPSMQTPAKSPLPAKGPAAAGCLIAEFRTIGLSVHNPSERHERAWNWLRANAKRCSLEQLQAVNNNRSSWLGSSDSPEIMGFLDGIIEYRTQGDEDGLKSLYNSKPLEAASTVVTTGLPERPAPLVQPGNSNIPNALSMPPNMPYGGVPQGASPGVPGAMSGGR